MISKGPGWAIAEPKLFRCYVAAPLLYQAGKWLCLKPVAEPACTPALGFIKEKIGASGVAGRQANFLRYLVPPRADVGWRGLFVVFCLGVVPQPLAATLTQLRVGNQGFLISFYQENRDLFARWARRQHQLAPAAAHELLRTVLLEFYDQVADGRLTKMPPDLRSYVYGMAAQYQRSVQPTEYNLPKAEAGRRQRLMALFGQLSADCQQVLMFFYFRGYNFETVAGKMGFANATVARIQKAGCLRRLYELHLRQQEAANA